MKTHVFERRLWASWAGIIIVLLLWQMVATLQLINPAIFPGPLKVLQDAFTYVSVNRQMVHIWSSLLRKLGFVGSHRTFLWWTTGLRSGLLHMVALMLWLRSLARLLPGLCVIFERRRVCCER